MIITKNSFTGNILTVDWQANIERGWFSQYPSILVTAVASNGSQVGKQMYGRPALGFLDVGPSVQSVPGKIQFPAVSGDTYFLNLWISENGSDWTKKDNVAFIAGSADSVSDTDPNGYQTMAKIGLGALVLAAAGYLLSSGAKLLGR